MKEHYDFSQGKRGAVLPSAPHKTRITIRLDADVIEWFRNQVNQAGGGNYQSLINEALREHMKGHGAVLEQVMFRMDRFEEILGIVALPEMAPRDRNEIQKVSVKHIKKRDSVTGRIVEHLGHTKQHPNTARRKHTMSPGRSVAKKR